MSRTFATRVSFVVVFRLVSAKQRSPLFGLVGLVVGWGICQWRWGWGAVYFDGLDEALDDHCRSEGEGARDASGVGWCECRLGRWIDRRLGLG